MDYLDYTFHLSSIVGKKLNYGKGLLTFKKRDDMSGFSEVCH